MYPAVHCLLIRLLSAEIILKTFTYFCREYRLLYIYIDFMVEFVKDLKNWELLEMTSQKLCSLVALSKSMNILMVFFPVVH